MTSIPLMKAIMNLSEKFLKIIQLLWWCYVHTVLYFWICWMNTLAQH